MCFFLFKPILGFWMLLYCFSFRGKIQCWTQHQLKLKVDASWVQFQVTYQSSKNDQANTPSRKVYSAKKEHTDSSYPGREDDFGARAAARSDQTPRSPHRPASYVLSRSPALECSPKARRGSGTGHEIRAAAGRSGGGKAGDDAGGSVGHLLPQPPRGRPHQPPLPWRCRVRRAVVGLER